MHGRSLSLLCTGTSIKSGSDKLDLRGQDSLLSGNSNFFRMRVKRYLLTYSRANSVITRNV